MGRDSKERVKIWRSRDNHENSDVNINISNKGLHSNYDIDSVDKYYNKQKNNNCVMNEEEDSHSNELKESNNIRKDTKTD